MFRFVCLFDHHTFQGTAVWSERWQELTIQCFGRVPSGSPCRSPSWRTLGPWWYKIIIGCLLYQVTVLVRTKCFCLTSLPDSHGENCRGVAVDLADVCGIDDLVHPGDDVMSIQNWLKLKFVDDNVTATCQRREPILRPRQSQHACSQRRTPGLGN